MRSFVLLLVCALRLTTAFTTWPQLLQLAKSPVRLWESTNNDQESLAVDLDCVADSSSQQMHQSLRQRLRNVEDGIGKRFVCRTQKGFLNVHMEPGNPYDTSNIVGSLSDGQIVTSTGPPRGAWIKHDHGGWSISVLGGFVWLEALNE